MKHDTPISSIHDEITVSNLPSIRDCPEDTIAQKLNQIAKQYGGKVTNIYGSNGSGSATLKFSSADQAKSFKIKYLHFKIQDRPINIHFCYKSVKSPFTKRRGKSFSQSPGPTPRSRNRTMSESGRKGKTSSEEYHPRRLSSPDSLLSDVNVDVKVEKQPPRFLDVSDSFRKLSVSKKKGHVRHVPSKQRYVSDSSLDEENTKMTKKTHSKIRSKLKLKNRKKSEATPQFLNQTDRNNSAIKDPMLDHSNFQMDKLVQISTNLTLLVDTQLVRLDLIEDLYKERYK